MDFKTPQNLAEQIAAYVEDKIISWKIQPGERVLESQIAEELGVSRSPVREALRILERHRLVELIPRKGARVCEISEDFIEWLYDILGELMGLVGRKCVENRTPEFLAAIKAASAKAARHAANADSAGYYEAIVEYAYACIAMAQNPLLEQLLTELLPSTRRILFAAFNRRKSDLKNNAAMVRTGTRYIERGDAANACQTVRQWVQNEKRLALKNSLQVTKEPSSTKNGNRII